MNRKKWIIALAILNLVLLPFTLTVACSDGDPAAPAGEQEEGLLLTNADMLGVLVAQMKPGVDKLSILTDPDVIATSREAWMREMVEISHESELAPGIVLYVYREIAYAPPGWDEGMAFDQEPGEDREPTCIVEDVENLNIFQKGHRWRQFLQCMERAVRACGGFLKSDFDGESYYNEEEDRVDFHGYVTCEEDPEGTGGGN